MQDGLSLVKVGVLLQELRDRRDFHKVPLLLRLKQQAWTTKYWLNGGPQLFDIIFTEPSVSSKEFLTGNLEVETPWRFTDV